MKGYPSSAISVATLCGAVSFGCTQGPNPTPSPTAGGTGDGPPTVAGSPSGVGDADGTGGASGVGQASGGEASSGSVTAAGGAEAAQGPAQILCVGDSITENPDSWMHPLERHLAKAGCEPFNFIGYDESPYNGPYTAPDGLDSRRIAAGGFSTRGILKWIESRAGELGGVPDFWIQYLGVNNVYGGFIDGTYNPDVTEDPGGAYAEDTKAFMDLVRSKNPKAHFLLVKIQDDLMPEIDAAIDETVSAKNTAKSPVIAIDGADDVSTTDGIHPDADGAKTLAVPIATQLTELMIGLGFCQAATSNP